MIKTIWQQILRQSCVLFVLLILGTYLAASLVDKEIFSPPRKQLHGFHLERLKNPAEFGLRIRKHLCSAGKVPCMLVEPDAQAGPGKRGQVLRQQLATKGIGLRPYGQVQATIVMLHGRNGRKESLLSVAERFVAAGFRCLIPDLPGHGENSVGRLSFGSSELERRLPRQVLSEMKQQFSLPDDPVALWGMSMGGAFAVSAARETRPASPPWLAMIVVSSFADLREVLVDFLPPHHKHYADEVASLLDWVRWLQGKPTLSSIRPQQWAKDISIPALLVHGDNDFYVPMSQGRRLFEALDSAEKRWITVPNGGHRNVLATPMQVYAEMNEWLLQQIH